MGTNAKISIEVDGVKLAEETFKNVSDWMRKATDDVKGGQAATEGWLPALSALGNSWTARIAEGVLLRDAIRDVIGVMKDAAVALPELALKGAGIADVEENFERLTAQAGLLSTTLMGTLREGTHNTVNDFQLMTTVNKDLAAGLKLTEAQYGTLSTGAFALAQATNVDVKTAFETMNEALVTGKEKALGNLVGIENLKKGEEEYARSMRTTVEGLNEEGQLQAKRAGILYAVQQSTKALGDQTDGLDERVAQLQTRWQNFQNDLGKTIAISPVLEAGLMGIQSAVSAAFGDSQQRAVQEIAHDIDQAAIMAVDFAKAGVEGVKVLEVAWQGLNLVVSGTMSVLAEAAVLAVRVAQGAAKASAATTCGDESKAYAASAAALGQYGDELAAMQRSFHDDAEAALRAATSHTAFDEQLDKGVAALETIRAKMADAATQSKDFVGPLEDVNDAIRRQALAAGAAAAGHANLVKQSAEEKAELKKTADAWKEYNSLRTSIESELDAGVIQNIQDDLKTGQSQQTLQRVYGVTATQMHAIVEEMKSIARIDELESGTRHFQGLADLGLQLNPVNEGLVKATLNLKAVTAAGADGLDKIGIKLKPSMDDVKGLGLNITQVLAGVSNDFVQLAQIGGDSFGSVSRDIGMAVKSAEQLSSVFGLINNIAGKKEGFEGGFNASNIAAIAAGWVGVASAVYSVWSALDKSAQEGEKVRELNDTLNRLSEEFGLTTRVSDQLATSIQNTRADLGYLDDSLNETNTGMVTMMAEGLHLNEILDELGDTSRLTATGQEGVARALTGIWKAIELGGPTAVAASKEVDQAIVRFGQDSIAATGLVDNLFLTTLHSAENAGATLTQTNQFIIGQLQSAASGLDDLLSGTQASLKEQDATFDVTADHAAGLGTAVAATFSEMIDRGVSVKDALTAVQPAIDSLNTMLAGTGEDGGAAFGLLSAEADIAADKVTGPLTTAIAGANTALQGMHNSGILNQQAFDAITSSATDAYNTIIAQGKDGTAALALMQPELQTAWELEQQFGYQADAGTQALIDQGVQAGIVGEQNKSAMDQVLDVLKAIGKALGADIPGDADKAKGALSDVKGKLDGLQDKTIHVTTVTDTVPGGSNEAATTSVGGEVGPNGVRYFGAGGPVFVPRGTDTIPAMLSAGEMVLNANQQNAVGALLKRGGVGSGNKVLEDKVDALHETMAGLREDLRSFVQALPVAMRHAGRGAY